MAFFSTNTIFPIMFSVFNGSQPSTGPFLKHEPIIQLKVTTYTVDAVKCHVQLHDSRCVPWERKKPPKEASKLPNISFQARFLHTSCKPTRCLTKKLPFPNSMKDKGCRTNCPLTYLGILQFCLAGVDDPMVKGLSQAWNCVSRSKLVQNHLPSHPSHQGPWSETSLFSLDLLRYLVSPSMELIHYFKWCNYVRTSQIMKSTKQRWSGCTW